MISLLNEWAGRIVVIVLSAICFYSCGFSTYYYIHNKYHPVRVEEKVKIKTDKEYITQYVKVPVKEIEFVQCYYSPIDIQGKINGDVLKVIAKDDCKKNEKDFKLTIKSSGNWGYYAVIGVGALATGLVAGTLIKK
jgi:hypothetical protein